MASKIYKILGKRGRITIPWEIRKDLGFAYNDVVSFDMDGDTVLVKREKICDGCKTVPLPESKENPGELINELVEEMTLNEFRTVLIHLTNRWAERLEGEKNA